jgi:hypothetical protein
VGDDKIKLVFRRRRETKRTILFDEQLGEQAWSDKDVAIGPLYVQKQALDMIGAANDDEIEVVLRRRRKE